MSVMPDDSIDLVVTDPPYGLAFMGKDWDKALPSVDTLKRLLRVLKPGAFAFVMCSARQDLMARMAIRLEDAGFDIGFDSIEWCYATGFPKAQNIGKKVDARLGVEREVINVDESAVRPNAIQAHTEGQSGNFGLKGEGTGVITKPATPEAKALDGSYTGFQPKPAREFVLVCQKPFTNKHKRSDVWKMLGYKYGYWHTQRTVVTEPKDGRHCSCEAHSGTLGAQKGNIEKLTKKWGKELQKIGYTLKDGDVIERKLALNPIYIDQVLINDDVDLMLWWKPYRDTDITSSVTHALATGKGITWLDNGRIPIDNGDSIEAKNPHTVGYGIYGKSEPTEYHIPDGRFAPNLLVSDDVLNDGRVTKSSGGSGEASMGGLGKKIYGEYALGRQGAGIGGYFDEGSFSRYFDLDAWADKNLPSVDTFPFIITPKPSPLEKNAGLDELPDKQMYKQDNSGESLEIFGTTDGGRKPRKNPHPTCKPIKLGAYLVAIGSRPEDIVYDPFCGSGSFCVSAAIMDRRYIGTEIDGEMCGIAERRIAWHLEQYRKEKAQLNIFSGGDINV
jgi:DNA modification methylase